MITYPEIYELLRKEKYSEQIQPLPKTFSKDLAEYFEDKRKIASKTDETFNDAIVKTKKQLENAITVLREFVTRRQKKIINVAVVAAKTGMSKKDSENMLNSEKRLFDAIIKELEIEEKSLNDIISGVSKEKDLKNKLVRFIQDTDEFSDLEGNKLGPFKAGDIANIPKEVAEILIANEKASSVNED
ncbi:MAG: hypothetical protein KKE23_02990 [Nanoarchaeota archaeon]|nr:hypothetical protein [Nanoarchaeota archaeon]